MTNTAGLLNIPLAAEPLTRKDFASDQEVRWCPGCGDYSILSTFQSMLPELGIARENVVVVSGIGCSSRFPYYVNTYGMHAIHGRAATIATGLAISRPDLKVFVVMGDGDAMAIGGNHLIHALRRNVNLTMLMFNNRIYGLTKGQYSPTSEVGKVSKSSPYGSLDMPFNPVSLAIGAGATFVARSIDTERAHLAETLKSAARHRGSSFVEIYQNCEIFNDGAWDDLKKGGKGTLLYLRDGQPIQTADGRIGVIRQADGTLDVAEVATAADPGSIAHYRVKPDNVVIHNTHRTDPTFAFAVSRLTDAGVIHQAPIGIFRQVTKPVYDDQVRDQVRMARGESGMVTDDAIQAVLDGSAPWVV